MRVADHGEVPDDDKRLATFLGRSGGVNRPPAFMVPPALREPPAYLSELPTSVNTVLTCVPTY